MPLFSANKTSKLALWALALVCVASFSLMLYASLTDSAIDDELAHIPAGYGYVHNLDYRLNPEHPPLIKALAMLPTLFLNPTFPTKNLAWTTEVNGQWEMGTQFLYKSGNDANAIIQTARRFPILITIFTLILIYFFARKLMGDWWALLPATLFGLSPTVLAHGHYMTTDVGVTFGIVLATYFFLAFMEAPSTKKLWLAGLAFGVAQVTKFSAPLLLPLFLFVLLTLWIRGIILEWGASQRLLGPSQGAQASRTRRLKKFAADGWHYLRNFILIVLIGYVVIVYPIYFIFTAHYPIARQVSDTQAILTSFANGPTPAGQICNGMRCLADLDIWAAKSPVLRPYAEYLLGLLMVVQRADGGNTIYFLGQVLGSGGWIYFPVLYLLKEPIPTLIIVIFALVLGLSMAFQRAKNARFRVLQPILDYIGVNLPEFTMGSFIILYWGYSMRSTLNIGIRHIIPTLPFIYILAAGVWKKSMTKIFLPVMSVREMNPDFMVKSFQTIIRSFLGAALKYLLLVALIIWLFVETITTAPYFLSYFNEFAGGTMNGYHYVTDSNYDWGQDLLRLEAWVTQYNKCVNPQTTSSNPSSCPSDIEKNLETPPIDKIAVDYFGGGNPKYYLGAKEVNWSSSQGDPSAQGIHWLAVSINTLEGATQPVSPGQTRDVSDAYSWLVALRSPQPSSSAGASADKGMGNVPLPDYRIGTSIFVYHL